MNKALLSQTLVISCLLIRCISAGPNTPSDPQGRVPTWSPWPVSGSPELPQSQEADGQTGQTIFGPEEEIKHSVNVADDVLQILRHDKRIQTRLGEGQSSESMSASWFAASAIDLNDDGQPDLIVQAVNQHLFGASLVLFWVFQKIQQGQKLILSVDALGLEVFQTKTNSYKNIRTTKATAKEVFSTLYEFDGDRYESRHSSRNSIND